MPEAIRELFLYRATPRLPWTRAIGHLALIVFGIGWFHRAALVDPQTRMPDLHGRVSLSLAVNRVVCGTPSALTHDPQIGDIVASDGSLADTPFDDVISQSWGSRERYCASATVPFVNNENSLMLLESWLLREIPGVSLSGIGRGLLAVKVVMIALFCLVLMRAGGSVALSAGVFAVGVAVLQRLQMDYAYSVYSFFFCLVAVVASTYAVAFETVSRPWASTLAVFVAGVVSAFGANMRTSYMPLFVTFFLIFVWAADRVLSRDGRTRAVRAASALAVFAVGWILFQYAFVSSARPAGVTSLSYHVIAHPLVLSLAVPPSPLSEREGLRWDDRLGLDIARRIAPDAQYLDARYEQALFQYYFSLWSRYPGEMTKIYLAKFNIAGKHMLDTVARGGLDSWVLFVLFVELNRLPSGLWLFVLLVAGAVGSVVWYRKQPSEMLLLAMMVTISAVLMMVEAAIIMPYFSLHYHQTLVFTTAVSCLLALQVVLPAVARGLGVRLPTTPVTVAGGR